MAPTTDPTQSPRTVAALIERLKAPKEERVSPDPETSRVVFLTRAYYFWSHPAFDARPVDRVTIESLLFRLRPLMMISSDESFIERALATCLELGADPHEVLEANRVFAQWFGLTRQDLGIAPLDPPADPAWEFLYRYVNEWPLVRLVWDYVYGQGPHSDSQRATLTTAVLIHNEYEDALLGIIMLMMWRARDVVVQAHNLALSVSGRNGQ